MGVDTKEEITDGRSDPARQRAALRLARNPLILPGGGLDDRLTQEPMQPDMALVRDNLTALVNRIDPEELRSEIADAVTALLEEVTDARSRERDLLGLARGLLATLRQAHIDRYVDSLTGIPGRGAADAFESAVFVNYREVGVPYAIILLDLDKFHDLNKEHGFAGGDYVLKEVAALISALLNRKTDAYFSGADGLEKPMGARAGGEEMLIILPETLLRGASDLAEKLRQTIANHSFTFEGKEIVVTASMGVAQVDFSRHETPAEVRKLANVGLNAAKDHGRNAAFAVEPTLEGVVTNSITELSARRQRTPSSRDPQPSLQESNSLAVRLLSKLLNWLERRQTRK